MTTSDTLIFLGLIYCMMDTLIVAILSLIITILVLMPTARRRS